MQLAIKRTIERVPGGMMLVPLMAGALIGTFAPRTADFFGSFTGALFTGALPILAVFYVCMGSTIAVRALPQVVRRGGALLGTKIALGIGAGVLLGHFLGSDPVRAGWFAGVSTLAVVAAINDTNGGLYMALMNQYGRPEDAASYSVMALESGPFLTMVTLGVAGLASFPWQTLLGAVLPLLVGLVLGNLDGEMRKFLGGAAPVMIPFFAFALGATLNLKEVWAAGAIGVGLGVGILLVSAAVLVPVDRLIGGTGIAGMAAATTAGNAAAVPALIAAANRKYAAAAAPATVLVASSVMVTTILAPVLTAWWDVRTRRGRGGRLTGGRRGLLVIADDLTGAADAGVALAATGLDAVVMLDAAEASDAAVVAIDADTRCREEKEAAAAVRDALHRHGGDGRTLFKKVDSTLRGYVAAELAAILEEERARAGRRVVAVMAPSFPAHGRTVVEGRLLVGGVPLEATDVWRRERAQPRSAIAEMLADAGLSTRLVGLEAVRAGGAMLERTLLLDAREADVVVCDAQTDADLAAIAQAARVLGSEMVWVGSAGLAAKLPRAAGLAKGAAGAGALPAAGPMLMVVGSLSGIAREQAEAVAAEEDLRVLRVPVEALLAGEESWGEWQRELEGALGAGRDALVMLERGVVLQQEDGAALCARIGQLVAGCAESAGALVATGGETARAVLEAWGIRQLRLVGEVEPGLPYAVAEKWRRRIPVLTKAGGFGRSDTLMRCRRFLRELPREARVEPARGARE